METSDQADMAASHVSNLTAAPLAPLICTNCKLPQTESAAATLSWLCPCPSSCSCIPGHTPSSYAHTNKIKTAASVTLAKSYLRFGITARRIGEGARDDGEEEGVKFDHKLPPGSGKSKLFVCH